MRERDSPISAERKTTLDNRPRPERRDEHVLENGSCVPSYNGWAVLPKVKHKDRHESRNSVGVYGGFDKIGPGSKRAAP